MNKLTLLSVFAFSTFFLAGCGTQPTEEIIDEAVVEDVIENTDTTDEFIMPTPLSAEEVESLTNTYVGLSVENAVSLAESTNTLFRILELDGEPQMMTMDYRIGRINASVSSGIVTAISIEGSENVSSDNDVISSSDESDIMPEPTTAE